MISIRRAFLYSLLVLLLLTYYLFSHSDYHLASVRQPTSSHSIMYTVEIKVQYSQEHASLLLPSFYPRNVQELLLHDPVPPSTYQEERSYILRQKHAGSTRLSSLKRTLEAETGIPLSIQSHIARCDFEGTQEGWCDGRERDTVTLDDVVVTWLAEADEWAKEHREEGRLYL